MNVVPDRALGSDRPGLRVVEPEHKCSVCRTRALLTMAPFPSMKTKQLLAVLMREPYGYRVVRQKGSHRILDAPNRPLDLL